MKFKAVVFDMDGVLIDARDWHYRALNQALSPFGLEISEHDHAKRFNGLSTTTKLRILSNEKGLPRELHQTIFNIKQDRTFRIASEKCFPILEHQVLLSRLQKLGLKIGVYTNSIRATAEYMLDRANISKYLDTLITNQDVDKHKPEPEGYLLACKNLGLSPKDVLVIEDGEYGKIAARNAGCEVFEVEGPWEVNIDNISKAIAGLINVQH